MPPARSPEKARAEDRSHSVQSANGETVLAPLARGDMSYPGAWPYQQLRMFGVWIAKGAPG
jgi:hypothetical protein